MIALLFAILSSSLIFVIFKLFTRFGIDTFQAIVFNYFTAFTCGVFLYGHEWNEKALSVGNWPVFAVISAVLFISLFVLMGWSSQRNGVALTSTAVKMSMGMSMLMMIFWYSEGFTILKILGIALAFLGVFLISAGKEESKTEKGAHWMLLVLFFGSGILDFVLNFVQNYELEYLSPSLFSAFGFGLAGCIGAIILLTNIYRKKARFEWKNVLAGVVLGIPNYFSIFLLIVSYQKTGWTDSTVLAINNIAVVIFSALIGFIIFKEGSNMRKIIGLVTSVIAIVLLYLAGIV